MNAALLAQLHSPDPIGIDLALLRTRLYRFSDDRRHYVLAEVLEERFVDGRPPQQATLDYVACCLNGIRNIGRPLPFDPRITDAEDIDLDAELRTRSPFTVHSAGSTAQPRQIVCILGAPRSGTSHLHNLLAYQRLFAYFTTVTCWAWPTRNLRVRQRHSFEMLSDDVLTVDNRTTRIIPGLVMPYEAEDVYARAIPTYRHVAGHSYDIQPAATTDASILRHAIDAHTRNLGRQRFLTKSPFNAFRIPQLEELYGKTIRYIHITRDRNDVAASMTRNRFSFSHGGGALDSGQAHDLFVSTIVSMAPEKRTLTVTHHDLMRAHQYVVPEILAWLDARI
ncbi:hypothetical protein HDA32_005166 [Spinactinospora alkalitolerans]|uniref:Sulfotransferase n=1 Tax=Spinactinospora alkalitolerans TaxID=687207 RepID=A0A852TZP3_9ACTN|nr:sulfotransferase [Spinactinospora alkalitolerans]NYE50046.1 hypothetical protein [Spinactinospora alkalitolerans]